MALETLPPDPHDIALVLTGALPPCPFCGAMPVTYQAVNTEPTFSRVPVYQSVVACTGDRCGATLGRNASVLEEARSAAHAAWRRRTCYHPFRKAR